MRQTSGGGVADLPSPWWTPARHADVKPFLAARSAITRSIRGWFDEQGFTEVETGILQILYYLLRLRSGLCDTEN